MLSHVVSRLERTHAALIEALVKMPWTVLDSTIVKSYTVFMGMLLSARPEYLNLVLNMIAQGLTFQISLERPDTTDPSTSSTPITRRLVYDRIHYLLRHLLALVPTLPSTLMPLLARTFPHKRQNVAAQSTYIRNLLQISAYCPELADKIMITIVDRTITIDVRDLLLILIRAHKTIQVEIQVELEELDEEDQPEEIFEIDPFDTLIGQEEEDSDDGSDTEDGGDNFSDISSEPDVDLDDTGGPEATHTNVRHIQAMVKKLDTILQLTFEHLNRSVPSSDRPGQSSPALSSSPLPELPPLPPLPDSLTPIGLTRTYFGSSPPLRPLDINIPAPIPTRTPVPLPLPSKSDTLRATFHTLLGFFDRTILLTFKSRYTQFLLFWYASLDPDFSDIFQGMLIERALLDPTTPSVTRAAAASYIGSFVSRARFVERDGARRVVGVLCDWLSAHVDSEEDGEVFYAVSQSLFLIFCFRWRDLQEDGKWLPSLGVMHAVVNSPLAPLRVCSPSVATQFARVAHVTDFMYCYPQLKGAGVVTSYLNTFFPFDPYRLPKSGEYIQGIYREWSEVAVDEEEEEEEDDEDEDEDSGIPVVKRLDIDSDDMGLGVSLEAMSISPCHAPIGVS